MTVRPLLRTTVAGLTLGAVALTGAPTAFAAPGDNGDVVIHSVGTAFASQSNEPEVCAFYLAAFKFDGLQQVAWKIDPQPVKPAVASINGRISLGETGTGVTTPLNLPNGMYKVTWTFKGAKNARNMKVFKVDCPAGANGPAAAAKGAVPPQGVAPQGVPPKGVPPQGAAPQGAAPQGAAPQGVAPQGVAPQGVPPQGIPPKGPVGAGGGGMAETNAESSSFGVGAMIAAGLAGTAGLILVRRSRRRTDGAS
ncbi:hypothetical protein J7I98_20565 [Streptomyces sp. ISL-98]|uniref:hypothetical protein n=1 Tax=Streptomyces sp. ISL-98 TaxID=2819192 RepID=UPI001BE95AF9|nr:hypothetical protein [Streptomyces sp. ISL-98]MBT2508237.1 hypothetical protein [Streptomyces sp. ISL-98]